MIYRKVVLNSLWGKFAQIHNLRKTEIVKHFAKYWNLLADVKIEILSEYTVSNDATILEYECKTLEDCTAGYTNIDVSSVVTSYAGLELYKLIHEIESVRPKRVLNFDTDSVIYVEKRGDPEIKTGDFLGELTNAIKQKYGDFAICVKFVSCGPKNFGIEVRLPNNTTQCELKVEGITLNAKSLSNINIEKMEEIALKFTENIILTLDVLQWNIV